MPESAPDLVTLDNGLRVLVIPVPHARSVAISAYLAAGARYEAAPEDAGLSHFVEHLCFKGTERRPRPQDIAVEIDAVGGSINAATERELTLYHAKVTPEHAPRAVDVIADMLRNSLYLPAEIERERGVILEELAAVEDSPDELSGLVLDGLLWPGQPHGRDIAGTPASVASISQERLVAYYRGQYVANAAVVAIAGAIERESTLDLVRGAFGGWPSGAPAGWVPDASGAEAPRMRLLAKDTEQAHLAFGLRAFAIDDPDRFALALLSIILGEGMSSRLFLRLREELALCYDIHSFVTHLLDTGSFGVYAGVDPDNAEAAVGEIANELRRVRNPVTAEELERAKGLVRSRIELRMEDTRAVAGWYGARAALGLPLVTPEHALACYESVTLDGLAAVADRVLRDDTMRLAVVGPFEDATPFDALAHL